ncbi:hypothetical protein [Alkalihalobacillus trypoxylicola]
MAGLITCMKCGKKMARRPYSKQNDHIICTNQQCN